jgi:hypothetical protein
MYSLSGNCSRFSEFYALSPPRNPYLRERISTNDLRVHTSLDQFLSSLKIHISFFYKIKLFECGGQLYWAFPFIKGSLSPRAVIASKQHFSLYYSDILIWWMGATTFPLIDTFPNDKTSKIVFSTSILSVSCH